MFGFKKQEMMLMAGVFALLLLHYPGILQDAPLPNWDAIGHFTALQEMARYLAGGHISGYLPGWYGGMPLFQFYAPLFFIVTAGLWLAVGKLISLALLFRVLLLLSVFAIVPSLWFFTRTFFGDREARWAVALSPLLLFIPKVVSTFGAGAASAFFIGLVPNALGLALAVAWPAVLERWRRAPASRGWAAAAVLVPTALVLTHTLTFIFGVIIVALWALANWREAAVLRRLAVSGAVAFALAAFWLVPFVSKVAYATGEVRSIGLANQLNVLFPFGLWLLQPTAAALLVLLAGGLVLAWRHRQRTVLTIYGGLLAMFLLQRLWSGLLPSLAIHYFRLVPLLMVMHLALAASALAYAWERWGDAVPRFRPYMVTATVTMVGISFFGAFVNVVSNPEIIGPGIPWRSEQYQDTADAERVIAWLGRQSDVIRVDFEQPAAETLDRLGSLSYWPSRLWTENRQTSTGGLYLEAAANYPVMGATDGTLQGQGSLLDETQQLRHVGPFVMQPASVQLDRLRFFGVNYYVTMTAPMRERLAALPGVRLATELGPFAVFQLDDARPMASATADRPAAFLSSYGRLHFRDVTTALYAGEQTFTFPLVELPGDVRKMDPAELARFSFLMVDGTHLDTEARAALASSGRPVVTLGGTAVRGDWPAVANFSVLERLGRNNRDTWPAGWTDLWSIVTKLREPNPEAAGTVFLAWPDDRTMVLRGRGPLAINLGYFPYWVPTAGAARVYRTAPDSMMVFADGNGEVHLEYRPDRVARAAQVLSLFTLFATALWLVWPLMRHRR